MLRSVRALLTPTTARLWHGLTAVVAVGALGLQAVLTVSGAAYAPADLPPLWPRVGQTLSYFTIQSVALVAVAAVLLTRDPVRDGRGFRWLRVSGLGGIVVTGLVHYFLLAPLFHGTGWVAVCDKLLHWAVPLLAVGGWLLFGPSPRLDGRTLRTAFVWPLAWLGWTLVVGQVTGWVPYEFLDAGVIGWPTVGGTVAALLVLFVVLLVALRQLERVLPMLGSTPPDTA